MGKPTSKQLRAAGRAAGERDMRAYGPGPRTDEQRAAAVAAVLAIRAEAARTDKSVITDPVISWADSSAHGTRLAASMRMGHWSRLAEDIYVSDKFIRPSAVFPGALPSSHYKHGEREAHDAYNTAVRQRLASGLPDLRPPNDRVLVPRSLLAHQLFWSSAREGGSFAIHLCGAEAGIWPAPPDAPVWAAARMAWQTPQAVILYAPPVVQRLMSSDEADQIHAAGQGVFALSGILHCATGPAVVWPNGEEEYWWCGRAVTAWLLTQPRLLAAVASGNAEARREAIEAISWDAMAEHLGMRIIAGPEPDPGNPGQVIRLWEIPAPVLGTRQRVLECWNGSEEPDGSRRRYMLFAGVRPTTALEAAAMLARLTPEQYAQVQRRT